MSFPTNEAETIELFRFLKPWIRWQIVHLQTKFPDAIIEHQNGGRLIVEFEHLSANYKVHEHPAEGCDLIVCFRDNWPEASLPVWALEEVMFPEKRNLARAKQWICQLSTMNTELRCKVIDLEQEIRYLRRLNRLFREEIMELRSIGYHPIKVLDEDGEVIRSFYVPFAYPNWLYSEKWGGMDEDSYGS